MGGALKKLFGKKDMRILMLGLDAAGKTSILFFPFSFIFFNHHFVFSPTPFSSFSTP